MSLCNTFNVPVCVIFVDCLARQWKEKQENRTENE